MQFRPRKAANGKRIVAKQNGDVAGDCNVKRNRQIFGRLSENRPYPDGYWRQYS